MFDKLNTNEYLDNYQSMMSELPFKHGSRKGYVLNYKNLINDNHDYDEVLRENVPSKFNKYFSKPLSSSSSSSLFDNTLNSEIEIGRSSKINLSPTKNHKENGIKESFIDDKFISNINLSFNDKSSNDDLNLDFNIDNDDLNDTMDLLNSKSYVNNNLSKLENRYYMNLDSNEKKETKYKNKENLKTIDEIDEIDKLCDNTYRKLNNKSLIDGEGKELNILIQGIINKLKDINNQNESLNSQNKSLNNNLNESKLIIKDLKHLIDSYKLKLKKYSLALQRQNIKNSNNFESIDNFNDVNSIDKQIQLLLAKKKSLQERKSIPNTNTSSNNIDISKLSDDIVQKLISQLSNHEFNHSINKDNTKENKDHDHDHDHNQDQDQHLDCPFCNEDTSNDLFSSFNLKLDNNLNQDDFINKLAETLQHKLKSNEKKIDENKKLPVIW